MLSLPGFPILARGLFVVALLAPIAKPAARAANRLVDATSPYLRQHAEQPVDWYPWGEDAFARARAEHKPIFLSIGYSTCHWCHVMAAESFADPALAAQLNRDFIAIKVDREQRPDLDRVYQSFVQALTGAGGWPLNVWLTPDLKPFYGGTYFPPADEGRHPGFGTVLQRIAAAWQADPDRIRAQSTQLLDALAAEFAPAPDADATAPDWSARRHAALQELSAQFDANHGGFDRTEKFPSPVTLEFLLHEATTAPAPADRELARNLLTRTLRAITDRGLHDHVGGGFHRYTVDPAWRVPHFEKTLYDQAQLVPVLLATWQITGEVTFRETAVATLSYLDRRLALPGGGFASAEDADSTLPGDPTRHREGAFYTWTAAELATVLPAPDLDLFRRAFAIAATGNVTAAQDPTGELAGQNVLALDPRFATSATPAERTRLRACLELLDTVRAARPRPARDDKVVTAWNGLTLSAYARAAQVLDEPAYLATARHLAAFLRAHLYDESTGRLARSHLAGRSDPVGFPEDYAALIQGLLDLYETDFDPAHLDWALRLQATQDALFGDPAHGGYFANAAGDTSVVLRLKATHDQAEPAATSLAVRNLGRLAALLHDDTLLARARAAAGSVATTAAEHPTTVPFLLAATGWLTGDAQQALLHAEPGPQADAMVRLLRDHPHPHRVSLRIDETSRAFFAARVPLIAALPDGPADTPTVYLCENFVCQLPVTTPTELLGLLAPRL